MRSVLDSPAWRRLSAVLACCVLVLLVLGHAGVARELAGYGGGGDFRKFRQSAERFIRAESPYLTPFREEPANLGCFTPGASLAGGSGAGRPQTGPALVASSGCVHPNLNPPVFVALSFPLGLLSPGTAWWCWWTATLLFTLLAGRIAAGALDDRGNPERTLGLWTGVALLGFFPLVSGLELGQLTPFLLVPTLLGWRSARAGHWGRSGAWLGLVAAIKPFFLLFIIGFLALRVPRALLALLLVFFGVTATGFMFAGLGVHLDYFRVLSAVTWTTSNWNASLEGFVTRILGGGEGIPLHDAVQVGRLTTGLSRLLLVAGVACVAAVHCRERPERSADATFAITLPAMLLASPLGWMYYFPLLLPAIMVLWRLQTGQRTRRLLLLGVVLPTAIPTGLGAADSEWTAYEALWGSAVYFYCLLGLFLLALAALSARTRGAG